MKILESKKGQVSAVLSIMLLIVLSGVLLSVFTPTIDTLRLERINEVDNYSDQNNVLVKLFLYAMFPIIWGLYLFLSVILLVVTVNASRGIV